MGLTRARQVSQRAREAKWLGVVASFKPAKPPSASCGGMSGRLPVPPRTDRPPTHTHTERRRDSSACLPRVAPAPNFLLAHATSSNSFDNTASRLSGKRGGEPDVAAHLFTRQELSSARKKGRDTAAGTDGVTYSMLAHPGPAGTPRASTLNASWLAGHLPPAWKEADIQPIPKPRDPTKLGLSPSSAARLKQTERMVLSRLQWRVGALHPHVFGFTRGVGTADSLLTLLTQANNCPTVTVFLDLEKNVRAGQSSRFSRHPREKGSGEDCSPARGLPPAPSGQVKFQGLKSRPQGKWENGRPRAASSARSCSTC
ncbi:hypothetical protein GWK47_029102 [Chionoecetes opilio]|uniref:Uncharacterized protein n=1 Tax=Chionoecetes opilio TaxID=41210 RepID=A0A8J4YLN9_CHIOP|nr:hypothetical protein GWK47_029102 [Chionoecetes opilio]